MLSWTDDQVPSRDRCCRPSIHSMGPGRDHRREVERTRRAVLAPCAIQLKPRGVDQDRDHVTVTPRRTSRRRRRSRGECGSCVHADHVERSSNSTVQNAESGYATAAPKPSDSIMRMPPGRRSSQSAANVTSRVSPRTSRPYSSVRSGECRKPKLAPSSRQRGSSTALRRQRRGRSRSPFADRNDLF